MPAGELAPEMLFQPARPVMRGFFTLSFFAPFDSGDTVVLPPYYDVVPFIRL